MSDRRSGLDLGPQLALFGLFVPLFLAIGYWLHSDIQEARQAGRDLQNQVTAAEVKRTQLEGDLKSERQTLDQYRKALELWSAHAYTETCVALKGTYNPNFKTCELPDGRISKYEAPFP